jgi:lysophospholipase L1-like esterase
MKKLRFIFFFALLLSVSLLAYGQWSNTWQGGWHGGYTGTWQCNEANYDDFDTALVVFFGNSTIYGFPVYSEDTLATISSIFAKLKGCKVINAGIAGNKIADLVARNDTDVVAFNPDAVVFAGGLNDALNATSDTSRGNYVAKCKTILDAYSAVEQVLVINVMSGSEGWGGTTANMNQRDLMRDSLRKFIAATYSNVTVVDLDTVLNYERAGGTAGNNWFIATQFTSDSLHFKALGNIRIANVLGDVFTLSCHPTIGTFTLFYKSYSTNLTESKFNDIYFTTLSPEKNYGASLNIYGGGTNAGKTLTALTRFELGEIPKGATVNSIIDSIYCGYTLNTPGQIAVYIVGQDWSEGTKTGAYEYHGASYQSRGVGRGNAGDLILPADTAWTSMLGTCIDTLPAPTTNSWIVLTSKPAFLAWAQSVVDGTVKNYGIAFKLLTQDATDRQFGMRSKTENTANSTRPSITVGYTVN